jgi:transcriptional regulator with XRE-family HTH domain
MRPKEGEGPDPVDRAIGARLRARRKSMKLSQTELANRIGVSFQQVQKYERGANRVAGSTLVAIAAALEVTVGWLVGEEGAGDAEDDVLAALALHGAVELLQAFGAIPGLRARAALVALAREMAGE